jgi:hypothetical protein
MSISTFSDVFEEQGVTKQAFYGGFGRVAEGGIPKAAFNAFRLLHLLGTLSCGISPNPLPGARRRMAPPHYCPTRLFGYAAVESNLIGRFCRGIVAACRN